MVKAMRKVDPTIKVIASGATPEEASWCYIENRQLGTFEGREKVSEPLPFAFGSSQDWTGALLKTSADHIDYLGEHFYGYPNLVIDLATRQFVVSDEPMALKVRRLSNRVQFKFEAWDEYLKRFPHLKDKDIRFAFDEWSPRNRGVGGGPAPVNHPMLNPLTNALVYHEFFRHSDKVGLAVATGGMGTLATDAYGDAIGLRMEGQVMKLLHDHFAGALPVAVNGNSPQLPTKGTVGIDTSARPSGSPTYPLDVFAALSADRRTDGHLGGQSHRDAAGVRPDPDGRPGRRAHEGLPADRAGRGDAGAGRSGGACSAGRRRRWRRARCRRRRAGSRCLPPA